MITPGFRPRSAPAEPPRPDAVQATVIGLPDGASAVVLGAPGTGKTELATALVVDRVLRRGCDSSEVVVLSATRRSATALRDAIGLRLGVPTRGPLARTATSIAFGVLRERATREGLAAPRLLSGPEQDAVLRELLAGHERDGRGPRWPEALPPEVRRLRGFRGELRELFARAVECRFSPDRLAALGRVTDHPEWTAAGDLFAEYHAVLDAFREGYLDATELLIAAATEVRERAAPPGLRLLIVDDAQEATAATIELLRAYASRGTAIIAIGDPDVAVGTFRGAAADALGRLGSALGRDLIPEFVLPASYRQRARLRAVTARVTGSIGAAGAGRQRAASSPAADDDRLDPVVRIEAASRAEELARVARRLREHRVLTGIPWERMAVVVRSGSLVDVVSRALAVAEVPAHSPRSRALADAPVARHLIRIAELGLHPERLDADTAAELLTGPFGGLDRLALRRLRLSLRQEELAGGGRKSGDELLCEALAAPGRLVTIDSRPARRAARLATTLQRVRARASRGTIEELLWEAWDSSGLAATWGRLALGTGVLAEEADRNLDAAVAIFGLARDFAERAPDAGAEVFLDQLAGAEIPADTLSPEGLAPAVVVGTPASVIGADLDIVAIVGLQEGVWPDPRVRGTLLRAGELADLVAGRSAPEATVDVRRAVIDDELRMFALAASRPRRQLILASVSNDDERPSPILRLVGDVPVAVESATALTLRGLAGDLRRRLAVAPDRPTAAALVRLRDEGVPGADPAEWYGLAGPSTTEPLVDLTADDAAVGVTPTSIETIEKSPLVWFVDAIAGGPTGLAAGIGTIVHGVMEAATTDPDAPIDPDSLWSTVEASWGELSFESAWIEERERRRARRVVGGLARYLHEFREGGRRLVSAEGGFTFRVGPAVLRGKIDRIERSADGVLTIVDLKTGRTLPTRAAIPDHAQLGSYQLAYLEGALADLLGEDDVDEDRGSAGAKLLFVATGAGGDGYKEFIQEPLDDDGVERFRERIRSAATSIVGPVFVGRLDLAERDPKAAWPYRIQLVPGVSA